MMQKSQSICIIPRNHKVEEALNCSRMKVIWKSMNTRLVEILKKPYDKTKRHIEDYQVPSLTDNKEYQTFCGT